MVEANHRAFDEAVANDRAGLPLCRRTIVDPGTIPDEEIRYYADPLRRLVRLHAGFNEITTGLFWISPWPRNDALFR